MPPERISRRDLLVSVTTSALAPALAALATNPADVAKTRLNMDRELQPSSAPRRYRGLLDCWRRIVASEGLIGLQRGLGFVLIRESSKNAFRIGLYEPAVVVLGGQRQGSSVPMSTRVVAGAGTGALAALICNPLDLLKTRLQLGARTSALDALRSLVNSEGVAALWTRGAAANIGRSALATAVALPVHQRLKEMCTGERVPLLAERPSARDLSCGLASSAATTLAINPLDLIRTRLFAQPKAERGAARYRGVLHCAFRIMSVEGLLAFWKGSGAAFLRIGPHQTLTFVFIGMLRRLEARNRRDADG